MSGQSVAVRVIRCSETGCGFEGEIIDPKHLPPNVIAKKFQQRGWSVGANDRHDICPSCVKRRTEERRARKNRHQEPSATAITTEPPAMPPAYNQPPKPIEPIEPGTPNAPAEMSRDDRRIIFAKLNDVYLDEERGYQAPWTDTAIAASLNCPQAWVAEVREQNFGPASDNSEVRDILARIEKIGADAAKALEQAAAHVKQSSALIERHNDINRAISDLKKSVDGALLVADRIMKAVRSA